MLWNEAGSDSASELAGYFHYLDQQIVAENDSAKLCLSCRRYPVITKTLRLDI